MLINLDYLLSSLHEKNIKPNLLDTVSSYCSCGAGLYKANISFFIGTKRMRNI